MRHEELGTPVPRLTLLEVNDLRVRFPTARGVVNAVNGVSFRIAEGERVAVVGESGSGKSVTARSILGLTPPPGQTTGSVCFKGRELVGLSERKLAAIRGGEIGLIMQDASSALDPLMSVGGQIAQALRLHKQLRRAEARAQTLDLLRQVRIGDPEIRMKQYSHELSGGMAQRAMTASAIGPEPDLLIADEPTSALDATTARGVTELISDLGGERGMAVLMITHDLGVVARFADRVIVMYAGKVVEEAPVDELFSHPRHPYTRGLLESMPGARGHRAVKAIPGGVPDLISPPAGCAFHPRCAHSKDRERCRTEVPLPSPTSPAKNHKVACHFFEELGPLRRPDIPRVLGIGGMVAAVTDVPSVPAPQGEDLLTVDNLCKEFEVRQGMFGAGGAVKAVSGASFTVRRGEVLALVGESGSGKTTTARMILGLEEPTSGKIVFDGTDISRAGAGRDRELRRRIQVVFQNPDSSLDPRMTIERAIAEPLYVHRIGTPQSRRDRVVELLEQVGLTSAHLDRYPFEFSGGQRQRIAIARALAPKPDFIVCDEPVTALDVSVQAQILNLLQDIQLEQKLSYLFIAHDLAVVRQISDRVGVMYLGNIVELADADEFFAQPHHPYSVALLESISVADPEIERRRDRVILSGTMPSPFHPPTGCPFHTRCWKAQETCSHVAPVLTELEPGRFSACHFPETADSAAPVSSEVG